MGLDNSFRCFVVVYFRLYLMSFHAQLLFIRSADTSNCSRHHHHWTESQSEQTQITTVVVFVQATNKSKSNVYAISFSDKCNGIFVFLSPSNVGSCCRFSDGSEMLSIYNRKKGEYACTAPGKGKSIISLNILMYALQQTVEPTSEL